jgi:hypothetical protein
MLFFKIFFILKYIKIFFFYFNKKTEKYIIQKIQETIQKPQLQMVS